MNPSKVPEVSASLCSYGLVILALTILLIVLFVLAVRSKEKKSSKNSREEAEISDEPPPADKDKPPNEALSIELSPKSPCKPILSPEARDELMRIINELESAGLLKSERINGYTGLIFSPDFYISNNLPPKKIIKDAGLKQKNLFLINLIKKFQTQGVRASFKYNLFRLIFRNNIKLEQLTLSLTDSYGQKIDYLLSGQDTNSTETDKASCSFELYLNREEALRLLQIIPDHDLENKKTREVIYGFYKDSPTASHNYVIFYLREIKGCLLKI